MLYFGAEMESNVNERIAVVESTLKQHEFRLTKHGEEIDDLKQENAKQETILNKLCISLEKNSDMTRANHEMIQEMNTRQKETEKWAKRSFTAIISGVPALISFYYALKQIGIF